jgi:hypothetical protein
MAKALTALDIVRKDDIDYAVIDAAVAAGKATGKVATALKERIAGMLPEQAEKTYRGILTKVRTVGEKVLKTAELGEERGRVYGALRTAWSRINAKPKGAATTRSWLEVRREEVDAATKALKEKEPSLLKVADVQRLLAAYEIVRGLLK